MKPSRRMMTAMTQQPEPRPPYGPLLIVLETGELWLSQDYYAGDPSGATMTFARCDLIELQRRYPRLHAAYATSAYKDTPRVLREP
jgi:hypothetical protein